MSEEGINRAFALIDANYAVKSDGLAIADDEIRECEERLRVLFPPSYRAFLKRYGSLVQGELVILGLGVPSFLLPSVECAIQVTRATHPDAPPGLVPIHLIQPGIFACIDCNPSMATQTEPSVIIWDITMPIPTQQWDKVATSFGVYLYRLIAQKDWRARAIRRLDWHVQEFFKAHQYSHAKGGKLPRNHEWRPYRYCIQDVLFGTTVVRHNREENCLDVDVFLTANIPEYDALAGAQALTTFLLSEAYKCGGTMELRFTREVEDGQVPAELRALAHRYDIHFRDAARGRITPDEAKALYAALTGFSPALQEQINALERAGRIKMARACYAIHHGVWSREQIEMIALGSQRPDSVLAGLVQPHQRHLYAHDLLHARAALLGGMLDRQLARRERRDATGTAYDLEDDIRPLEITFDGDYYAKGYRSDELIGVPWLHDQSRSIEIQAGSLFYVLVRARDAADMLLHLESDLRLARQLRDQRGQPVFILVPNDFTTLPDGFAQRLLEQAETLKIRLMVCPETVLTFDADAAERLARSRILRK